jgi:hypothetical protein
MPKLKIVNDAPTFDYKIDELVKAYNETDNVIDKIKERYQQELKKPNRLKELLTEQLLNMLKATGQEMARTKYGTVSAAVRDIASCSDPNMFIDYVREHDAYELMDRRPNSTACRVYVEEHGMTPPGVKLNSIRYISVRHRKTEEDLT